MIVRDTYREKLFAIISMQPWVWVVVVLLLVAIMAIAMVWRTKERFSPVESHPQPSIPSDFRIYNYLPRHAIRVSVVVGDTTTQLVSSISPDSVGHLTRDQVVSYLVGGNVLRFDVIDPDTGVAHHFTDYMIDTSRDERIKNLHVGMVTTRYIGGSMDSLNMVTPHANAGLGSAWLVIHNPTYIPLRLNDDIIVQPHSTFRYLGYLHEGVTMGTYFKDPSGLYPTFQYLRPHNHLYYGVVSDIRQPLYGCWQTEFNDQCDYGQTLWPFQEGVM